MENLDSEENPYISSETPWNKFDILHPKIVENLQKHGFQSPTQIQAHTLANYPHHNDFIIASMTVSN